MSTARPLTLADAAAPRSSALLQVLFVVAASLVTAGAAQLEFRLPWTPVPMSGQSFAVLLTGAVLGARRAFLAQCLYLAEGAAGLPFFSGGASGIGALLGPSGGYLIAFPFAASLTGLLAERGWDRRPLTMFAAMLLGSTVMFALGLAHLADFVPEGALLASGLLPFLPGDMLKAALAAGLFPALWKLVSRFEGRA